MMLNELIRQLQELSDAGHGEATVRIAEQPHWPFEYSIDGFKVYETKREEIEEIENLLLNKKYPEDEDDMRQCLEQLEEDNETIVYIREGSQLDYISKSIWDD